MREIVERIKKAKNVAIYTHINPDGDALGSAYALKLALHSMGICAGVFLEKTPVSSEYLLVEGKDERQPDLSVCDLKICVDCADASRLGTLADSFLTSGVDTICIDHHKSSANFAKINLIEPDSAACGELIYLLITEGLQMRPGIEMMKNIYMAIATDTGCFKFSNTTARTHKIAAKLMESGLEVYKLNKALFETVPYKKLFLRKVAIEKITFFHDNRIAIVILTQEDFEKTGMSEDEAAGIVAIPRSIEGVEVAACIRQKGENEYKVSLRSNDTVDVSDVAASFGGGGHMRAGGCTMTGEISEITQKLLDEIARRMSAV